MKKPQQGWWKRQVNAWTVFRLIWNCSHGIHPRRVAIYEHHYKVILCRLCNSILCKRPELWCRKNWLLLYDNAPAELCTDKKQVTILPHPPYSPDPHILFSFPAWKKSYVGVHFSRPSRSFLPQGKPFGTFLQISCSSVSSNYTNVGRLAKRHTATILREDVDMCKCMWISWNMVCLNHSPRYYWL
jgi:hypothetical protein